MEILLKGLPSHYRFEHTVKIFYPAACIKKTAGTRLKGQKMPLAYGCVAQNGKSLAAGLRVAGGFCKVVRKRLNVAADEAGLKQAELVLCRMIYDLLFEETGINPPWGMLTGVRPVRFYRRLAQAANEAEAQRMLKEDYGISGQKLELVQKINEAQKPVLAQNFNNSYSLYISIPFCPSRCSYCSFVSREIGRDAALADDYLQALCKELKELAMLARRLEWELDSIYIGGGTPASLSTEQIKYLLACVEKNFDTADVKEYSFEAGRPDCTSYEKLEVLKSFNISRVCINPQSMNDNVLQAIGRRHTAQDIERCFYDARRAEHTFINMDLIAGLPAETEKSFEASIERVLKLGAENLTLHTLSIKRAADLTQENAPGAFSIDKMLSFAYKQFANSGFMPYYLYRQKNQAGNLENTGWCLPGFISRYNVNIMEESQNILSAGAGGASKLVLSKNKNVTIQRFFNHKYPLDYLADFENSLREKSRKVEESYAGNVDTQTFG